MHICICRTFKIKRCFGGERVENVNEVKVQVNREFVVPLNLPTIGVFLKQNVRSQDDLLKLRNELREAFDSVNKVVEGFAIAEAIREVAPQIPEVPEVQAIVDAPEDVKKFTDTVQVMPNASLKEISENMGVTIGRADYFARQALDLNLVKRTKLGKRWVYNVV